MKESGIEWIGSIPSHWPIRKIGQMYYERRTKVNDIDFPPLSVTMKGILPQIEGVAKTDAHDSRKLVLKGDFAINSRSDRRGACGIADRDGSVSIINIVLQPREGMNPSYLNWLFHTSMFADEFYRNGQGIVDDMWTTKWNDMKRISIPFPELDEQSRIASFLDSHIAKIDDSIARYKALSDKLDEYRYNMISKITCVGIREKSLFTSLNNEFLDRLPKDWEYKRLKFTSVRIFKGDGITKDEVDVNGNIQCIRYGEIYSKYDIACSKCYSLTNLEAHISPKYAVYGDLLFAGTGELIEDIGKNIVYLGSQPCLVGGDIIVVRHNQNPKFLSYALNSHYARAQKSKGKSKLKVVHISASEIGNIRVAIPPLDEQAEIVAYLDKKCTDIDSSKAKIEAVVKKLEEYKKSLIYNAVTGKIEC